MGIKQPHLGQDGFLLTPRLSTHAPMVLVKAHGCPFRRPQVGASSVPPPMLLCPRGCVATGRLARHSFLPCPSMAIARSPEAYWRCHRCGDSKFVFLYVAWPRLFPKFRRRDPSSMLACFSRVSRWWLSHGRLPRLRRDPRCPRQLRITVWVLKHLSSCMSRARST